MPEDVPEDIAELLAKYKTGGKKALTEEQLSGMFDFLSTVPDVKSLVMGETLKFTEAQYESLKKMMGRAGVTKKATTPPKPEKVVAVKKSAYFSDFAKLLCDDAWGLGTETVMRWYQLAGELGYYNKDLKRVDMPSFVRDSIEFFVAHRDTITELEQENISDKVFLEVLGEALNRTLNNITNIRITLDTILQYNPELSLKLASLRALAPELIPFGRPLGIT